MASTLSVEDSPERTPPGWRGIARLNPYQGVPYALIATTHLAHLLGADATPPQGWGAAAIWTLTMGALASYPALLQRRLIARGWIAPYVAGRLLICAYAAWLARIGFLPTLLFYLVVAEAIHLDRRIGRAAGVAAVLVLYLEVFLRVGPHWTSTYVNLLTWVAGMVFIVGVNLLMLREQEARARAEQLLVELTAAHRQLQDYAGQVRELATTQERNRLAREIHDTLGHYLTVINVQLESAQALRAHDPARADRAIGAAKRLASEALADARRSVAALRPSALDELSVAAAIARHVADSREHSGLPVTLTIEGDEKHCSQAAGLALYRAVQEGLTNVRKHAGATQAAVTLRFAPAATELTVRDNGCGMSRWHAASPPADGGGFGLAGLHERMVMLGGTLDVVPAPGGGTELWATIPAAAAAAKTGARLPV